MKLIVVWLYLCLVGASAVIAAAGTVPSAEDSFKDQMNLNTLNRWMKGAGIELDGVAPALLSGSSEGTRGMVCEFDVREGTTVFSAPFSATMGLHSAFASPIGPALRELVSSQRLRPEEALMTHLIFERYRSELGGGLSPWTAFIETLPEEFAAFPLFWESAALGHLKSPAAVHLLTGQYKTVERLLNVFEAGASGGAGAFPPHIFSLTNAKWALCVVASCAVWSSPSTPVLVPGAHLFNHASGDSVARLTLSPAQLPSEPSSQSPELPFAVVVATHSCRRGEQMYVSYGPLLTGAEFVVEYGFLPSASHVLLLLPALKAAARTATAPPTDTLAMSTSSRDDGADLLEVLTYLNCLSEPFVASVVPSTPQASSGTDDIAATVPAPSHGSGGSDEPVFLSLEKVPEGLSRCAWLLGASTGEVSKLLNALRAELTDGSSTRVDDYGLMDTPLSKWEAESQRRARVEAIVKALRPSSQKTGLEAVCSAVSQQRARSSPSMNSASNVSGGEEPWRDRGLALQLQHVEGCMLGLVEDYLRKEAREAGKRAQRTGAASKQRDEL